MTPRLALVLLISMTVVLDVILPVKSAALTDYSSPYNSRTVSQSETWPRGRVVVRRVQRGCSQRPASCQYQPASGTEMVHGAGGAGLADELILTSTTRPPHPAQYIVDDLKKPSTTAPQTYLRSLCTTARGVFPHPLDCRKFLDCWDGRVREKFCPDDQVFSDLPGGFCDYQQYVDCGHRPLLPTLQTYQRG